MRKILYIILVIRSSANIDKRWCFWHGYLKALVLIPVKERERRREREVGVWKGASSDSLLCMEMGMVVMF